MDDPFAVFDTSDDDDDDVTEEQQHHQQQQQRDASSPSSIPFTDETTVAREVGNGPMCHHRGIEQALLQYVKNQLDVATAAAKTTTTTSSAPPTSTTTTTSTTTPSTTYEKTTMILDYIDQFCYQRHWMMHVGPEKGAVLEDFLCQSLRRYRREYHDNPQPFVLLEVGTYCGYSALRMLQIMERVLHREQHHDDDDGDDDGGDHPSVPSSVPPSFRVISVDVDPVYQGVARQLVDLAGYTSDHVRFHLRTGTDGEATTLVDVVRRELQRRSDDDDDDPTSAPVRFVFLDHEKEMYLSDLRALEQSQIIQRGCHVAADNVVVFRMEDYRTHVQQLATAGVVETELRLGHLEYVSDLEKQQERYRDGMECTIYLQDPSSI